MPEDTPQAANTPTSSDAPTELASSQPSSAQSESGEDPLESVLPPEVSRRLPPQVHSEVSAFFSGQIQNPIAKKITEGHIDKALNFVADEGKRRHTVSMTDRCVHAGLVLFCLVFLLILIGMLKENADTLRLVMTGLLTFLGGLGLGRVWGNRS